MYKPLLKKVQIIPLICILLTIGFFTFLLTEVFTVKHSIDEPKQTLFYDNKNQLISVKNEKVNPELISPIIKSYLKKELNDNDIAKQLFNSNLFRQTIAKLLLATIYNKEDKVNLTLDHLYFQNGIIGIQTASTYYFNKSLENTSELEQLFLLSQGNQPHKTAQVDLQFKKFLSTLNNQEDFRQAEINSFTNQQIDDLFNSIYNNKSYSQSYLQQTISEAKQILEKPEEDIIQAGYIIETNMDRNIQNEIHTQFRDNENFPTQEGFHVEGGMVILNRNTGAVTALMGGRKYQHNALNRASEIKRQPASTFKPLMVYAPALEIGWVPSDQLKDVPLKIGDFRPQNYDHTFRQQTSLEDALVHSYNVPTVWLLYKIGLKTGLEYIKKFDLFEIDEQDGYKLALGYSSKGSNPLALAQAYSIFPNEGNMLTAATIRAIKTESGKVVYKATAKKKSIITSKTAKTMDKLLQETVQTGTGHKANIEGQFIAGKTGTTSYDGWFVGYNKEFISAIWMGPDEINPMEKISVDGGGYPALLFKKVFTEISK